MTVLAKTQETLILNHLKARGSITAVEAQALYKVRSLTRRITTLRRTGANIESVWKTDLTGQRYVRYHYHKPVETLYYGR